MEPSGPGEPSEAIDPSAIETTMIAERLVAVGTLAAGVAHEINNPLAAVTANLDMAIRDLAEVARRGDPPGWLRETQEILGDAREAAERVRLIVRDVKLFSRAGDDKVGPVDVHRVLDSALRMAWNEIRHRARVVKDYGAIPPVHASEPRLGQVFLNLIVNAAQAIPEGRADENLIRVATFPGSDGRVCVEVSDTGAGIAPEDLGRLFTPFFSTKPHGMGMGLGLSICQRILSAMGGDIAVDSELGRGTAMRVLLPPSPDAYAPEPEPPGAGLPPRRGRVLIIDDEPVVASALERVISGDHDVEVIGRAAEALERIAGGRRYDVILCDLMMPHGTGMDLYPALLRDAPDQAGRMIFLTGGAFTPRARAFLDQIPNPRVDKPFDPTSLRALVNDRIR